MAKRILSGVVGISFIVSVIILSGNFPVIIDVFVAAVCAIAVGEFANAAKILKHWQISFPSMAFAVIYPMLMNYGSWLIVGYAYTAVMFSMLIFFHEKISFKEFAYIYSMTIVITLSLSTIIQMKNMDNAHPAFYFVLTLALPWLADAGAYFAEFVYKNVHVNYINLAILSLIGSLLSILGDLSFSVIKRTFEIKDYGNLIPGHGGVLDRFDSVVIVSPFLYIMMAYMPVIMGV